jgi:hypothetical protein
MPTLFRTLLGDAFDRLPEPVRALHDAALPARFVGEARVSPARGLLARAVARWLGFPVHACVAAIAVTIEAAGGGEHWTRDFPPRPMRSRLWPVGGRLRERFGPVTVDFLLRADDASLVWKPVALRLFGLPLPAALRRGIEAREWVEKGRYRFAVHGALPGLGTLVRYEGWLDVPQRATPP